MIVPVLGRIREYPWKYFSHRIDGKSDMDTASLIYESHWWSVSLDKNTKIVRDRSRVLISKLLILCSNVKTNAFDHLFILKIDNTKAK